jgi:hypothetical protein
LELNARANKLIFRDKRTQLYLYNLKTMVKNTLLNYCGIKGSDLISFIVDKSHHKQDKYLPGSRILVKNEKEIIQYKPDYIIIFPWNIKDEVMAQLTYVKEWGCKFVVLVPELQIYE